MRLEVAEQIHKEIISYVKEVYESGVTDKTYVIRLSMPIFDLFYAVTLAINILEGFPEYHIMCIEEIEGDEYLDAINNQNS